MKKGDFIKIDFIGRLESGEIFDLTDEKIAKDNNIYNPKLRYKPAVVILGAGFIVPGLEKALLEMKPGEKKEIIINPDEAFGQRNPELVKTVPEKVFEGKHVIPGMIVDFGNSRGRVQSISAGRARIDFNHPLAGKTLKFEVDVKQHIDDEIQKVEAILDFFGIEPKIYMIPGTYEIEADAPPQIKERISSLVLEYIDGVSKIRFVQTFSKQSLESDKPVSEEKLQEKPVKEKKANKE
ncbi:MAG: peptidylprolyl isomerase [Candidatus Aenigmarchaeota archaeon]|nr:peptidylprolyl isomerase [Candidatus Aenigmarchaeota archaeon]